MNLAATEAEQGKDSSQPQEESPAQRLTSACITALSCLAEPRYVVSVHLVPDSLMLA